MKKREELEAIVEQLHEWCLKYDEDYVTAVIIDNGGAANIGTNRPDYWETNIYKDYSEKSGSENTEEES